jgi:hypothetical protein
MDVDLTKLGAGIEFLPLILLEALNILWACWNTKGIG